MAQGQTWDNCDYFSSPLLCPPMNESELMKEFAFDAETPYLSVSINHIGIEERSIEINKLFCNKCSEFRPIE
jgi:hypothetical protein